MRQWVEGPVTHTQEYIEWYRKNTTQFLFVAQQQNDPPAQPYNQPQPRVLHMNKRNPVLLGPLKMHPKLKMMAMQHKTTTRNNKTDKSM